MSVIYIALPLALGLGALALFACIACIRNGQFDDLESPPVRMLLEDSPRKLARPSAENGQPQDAPTQDVVEAPSGPGSNTEGPQDGLK